MQVLTTVPIMPFIAKRFSPEPRDAFCCHVSVMWHFLHSKTVLWFFFALTFITSTCLKITRQWFCTMFLNFNLSGKNIKEVMLCYYDILSNFNMYYFWWCSCPTNIFESMYIKTSQCRTAAVQTCTRKTNWGHGSPVLSSMFGVIPRFSHSGERATKDGFKEEIEYGL